MQLENTKVDRKRPNQLEKNKSILKKTEKDVKTENSKVCIEKDKRTQQIEEEIKDNVGEKFAKKIKRKK